MAASGESGVADPDLAAVTVGVQRCDGLLVYLCDEDVRDGAMHTLRRWFEKIGEADVHAAFAEPNGGVQRGEASKPDVEGRDGCARTKGAILLFKDRQQGGEHGRSILTSPRACLVRS